MGETVETAGEKRAGEAKTGAVGVLGRLSRFELTIISRFFAGEVLLGGFA